MTGQTNADKRDHIYGDITFTFGAYRQWQADKRDARRWRAMQRAKRKCMKRCGCWGCLLVDGVHCVGGSPLKAPTAKQADALARKLGIK